MSTPTETPASLRWPDALVRLHWLTALAVAVGVGAVLWREAVDARALRAVLLDVHRACGIMVFALACIRLALRLRAPAQSAAKVASWMDRAAAAVHAALYAGLLAVPLLGWWLGESRGLTSLPFGITLPHVAQPDPDRAEVLASAHAFGAWALLALVVAHVAAALWHQFIRRDDVLRAMVGRSPQS